ncbi:hypothetical protein B6N60_03520 [Richelia sinica FACHB-800]|uniref:Uncharacterized protein n=1 Tax=Richelia sinica FACHB-800 TaxID=1357546 RepID=A0A975Y616_9NOST|nr:hypothetical protein B6N60_03520 [Richelia sinica FACHB-800]
MVLIFWKLLPRYCLVIPLFFLPQLLLARQLQSFEKSVG